MFAFFLSVLLESTRYLDITKLSTQAMIPKQSAKRYFEILEETLIVNRSFAFSKSLRRRLVQHPRFFFFDNGVLNGLLENFHASLDRKGFLFENLIFNQILSLAKAMDQPIEISNYRTEHGAEIDFIVHFKNQIWAIETKSSDHISKIKTQGFKSFKNFYGKKHHRVVCYLGKEKKIIDGIEVLPWKVLMKRLI